MLFSYLSLCFCLADAKIRTFCQHCITTPLKIVCKRLSKSQHPGKLGYWDLGFCLGYFLGINLEVVGGFVVDAGQRILLDELSILTRP